MKDTRKILLALLPVVVAAGVIFILAKKKKSNTHFRRRQQIAEEGYETAGDILFPPRQKQSEEHTYLYVLKSIRIYMY